MPFVPCGPVPVALYSCIIIRKYVDVTRIVISYMNIYKDKRFSVVFSRGTHSLRADFTDTEMVKSAK